MDLWTWPLSYSKISVPWNRGTPHFIYNYTDLSKKVRGADLKLLRSQSRFRSCFNAKAVAKDRSDQNYFLLLRVIKGLQAKIILMDLKEVIVHVVQVHTQAFTISKSKPYESQTAVTWEYVSWTKESWHLRTGITPKAYIIITDNLKNSIVSGANPISFREWGM